MVTHLVPVIIGRQWQGQDWNPNFCSPCKIMGSLSLRLPTPGKQHNVKVLFISIIKRKRKKIQSCDLMYSPLSSVLSYPNSVHLSCVSQIQDPTKAHTLSWLSCPFTLCCPRTDPSFSALPDTDISEGTRSVVLQSDPWCGFVSCFLLKRESDNIFATSNSHVMLFSF